MRSQLSKPVWSQPSPLRITLFCGGRGSASLIREILRIPRVKLNLLVNAYDNGSSTGELRRYIPGYLGPSDFRKNLSYLLELHSPEQYALSKLIDYRMPEDFNEQAVNDFIAYVRNPAEKGNIPPELLKQLEVVNGGLKQDIYEYLKNFLTYYLDHKDKPFNFKNCSLGNLFFAGAFLKNNNHFEKTTQELMTVFQSKTNAKLINVTGGENRFLMGLKEDGELLSDEADIVKEQSQSKFSDIYLIPEELTREELKKVNTLDFEEKKKFLQDRHQGVSLSNEAQEALTHCDIILFGPGTQFSSLFPSYKTLGIGDVIASSHARIKVFILNINKDHDIQSYSAEDLIDSALSYLGDRENNNLITHAFFNEASQVSLEGVKFRDNILSKGTDYKNVRICPGDYEHPVYPGIHSGTKTIKALLDLYENEKKVNKDEMDIYVDLSERSVAAHLMIEEFLEIDWRKYFNTVRLYINNVKLPKRRFPDYVKIEATKNEGYFSEVEVFKDWFWNKESKYLVTITGDGEYRMQDILNCINILESTTFGAAYGSRNQSRRQFLNSLNAAYGESRFLFHLSRIGAICSGILFALRFSILFSDPLTGFRVYDRAILKNCLKTLHPETNLNTSLALTRYIVRDRIEIAEIPVRYRTFKGFTNVKWRFSRGMKNLMSIFF